MLEVSGKSLQDFSDLALHTYATTLDFSSLHLVTATHALRLVDKFIQDKNSAYKYFWQAVAAAYLTIGRPEINKIKNNENLDNYEIPKWTTIIEKVRDSKDSHDNKLVYSANEEQRQYTNDLYRMVAGKRTKLIK